MTRWGILQPHEYEQNQQDTEDTEVPVEYNKSLTLLSDVDRNHHHQEELRQCDSIIHQAVI